MSTISRKRSFKPLNLRQMFKNRRKSRQESKRKSRAAAAAAENDHHTNTNDMYRRMKEKDAPRHNANRITSTERYDRYEGEEKVGYDSPPRPKMPKEIKITPGTPDSAFSAVSDATELPEQSKRPKSMSMFKSVLPEMSSETEDCSSSSMDRSAFTWATNANHHVARTTAVDEACGIGAMGLSGSTTFDDDDDDSDMMPTTNLFDSPKKVNLMRSKKETILTRSRTFQKLVDYSYDVIDSDGSGTIDKKELYAGLILIHLNLAAYVGPAACRPATREYVDEMFDILDQDQNGTLDKEEFKILMTILCSQIASRVFLQLSMALMIVPFISKYLVDLIQITIGYIGMVLKEIDDNEVISEYLMGLLENCWNVIKLMTPPILQRCFLSIYENVEIDTMPLTVISCLLGCMIVPWLLYKCDEFHNSVASRESLVKKKNVKKNAKKNSPKKTIKPMYQYNLK